MIAIPRPVHLWRPNHRKWVVPLYFLFSTGWSLEMYVGVTALVVIRSIQLEQCHASGRYFTHRIQFRMVLYLVSELTFWLFLLNQGRVPREWFRSFEYTIWCLGLFRHTASRYLTLTPINSRELFLSYWDASRHTHHKTQRGIGLSQPPSHHQSVLNICECCSVVLGSCSSVPPRLP